MSRPFAVIGFSMFFILWLFFNSSNEAAAAALAVFAVSLAVSLFVRVIRRKRYPSVIFASCSAALILLIIFNQYVYLPRLALDGKGGHITAVLSGEPQMKYGNCYYPSEVTAINGQKVSVKTRLVFSAPPEAEPFDTVEGYFTFYALGSSSEEILDSYKASGTYLGAFSDSQDFKVTHTPKNERPLGAFIMDFRSAVRRSVYRILPNEYGALATALILGDRSGISAKTAGIFSRTGITHIICVSGLHLSIWGITILNILKKTGAGHIIPDIVSAAAVLFIMLVTGMSYSIIRAGIMMLVFLLSDILSRRRDALNSLGFSVAVMAVADPFSMGSAGLQLSVLSTAGIIFCSMEVLPDLAVKSRKILTFPGGKFLLNTAERFFITFSAILFTLPVSARINNFSFSFFPTNLLVVWAAGSAMVLCAVGALVGVFAFGFFNLPAFLGGLLCKFIIGAAGLIDRISSLDVCVGYEKSMFAFGMTAAFGIFCFFISKTGKKMPAYSALLCAFVFIFSMLVSSAWSRSDTRIEAVNAGNGTSVLISKNGHSVLIGSGTDDSVYDVCSCVRQSANSRLDGFFITGDVGKNVLSVSGIIAGTAVDALYGEASVQPFSIPVKNAESVDIKESLHITTADGGNAVLAETEDISVLICDSPHTDIRALPGCFREAEVLITRNDIPVNYDGTSFGLTVINAVPQRGKIICDQLRKTGRSCIFQAEGENTVIRSSDGVYSVNQHT